MVEGVLQPTDVGTPQGGPLSPILSNILLDDLDKELERRGLPFVRYADDFAVFAKVTTFCRADHGIGHAFLNRRTSLGREPGEESGGGERGIRVLRIRVP